MLLGLHFCFCVQSPSHVLLFVTPRAAMGQPPCPSLSPRVCSNSCLLSQWCCLSNYLILCWSLLLLLSIFPSIRVFSSESVLPIGWPKYCSFSFSISPFNEYSGWISFMIDWFCLLAFQVTLKSLLQDHNSKASIFWHSVFFFLPSLTSIHDYWKTHSFDHMVLCQQSDISAF